MPFTDHRGAESLLDQNLGERGTFGRDVTVSAGKTDRALADAGHAVGRVVSPGEQTRSRRGAQRCGVPLPVPQSVARDAVDVRRLDRSPVTTQGAVSDVVENDVKNIRCAGGGLRLLVRAPVGNRIANIEVTTPLNAVGHDLAPCRSSDFQPLRPHGESHTPIVVTEPLSPEMGDAIFGRRSEYESAGFVIDSLEAGTT